MTLRRVSGSLAQIHNALVHSPQSAPWPMCRRCNDVLEEIEILDNPEPRPGKNPLVVRVLGRCHGEEEVVAFDLLSEETLAQDPEALQKVASRWRWFDEAFGHLGN